jgi:hypothetical protein
VLATTRQLGRLTGGKVDRDPEVVGGQVVRRHNVAVTVEDQPGRSTGADFDRCASDVSDFDLKK